MKKILGLLLLLAAPAAADEVVLRNGSVFSGVVSETADRVTVVMDYGTMTFRKIDVLDVRRTDDPLKELERKVEAATSPKQIFEVALWARDRGLAGRSLELCEKVIALDPDHEGARKALGFERHEGTWLKGDDLMVARGFIRHEGKWLRKDTVEQILAQQAAESIEIERQKTLRQAAENEREIELQRIALERERLDFERDRRNQWWNSGFYYGPPVYVNSVPYGPLPPPGAPGRTVPPVPDRPYPSWSQPVLTPPPAPVRGGGPPIRAK